MKKLLQLTDMHTASIFAGLVCFILLGITGVVKGQTITSISPASGPVGTLVTISGSDLSNPTAFTIGGTPAIVISNTSTTLVGMVMPGAATGNITITTPSGTDVSESNFTVIPTPYPSAQHGNKLIGTGVASNASQGYSVAVSADGNTAIVGGYVDSGYSGASWVYTRSGGVWTQQGSKLVGTGAVGQSRQGWSVSLSADGNTAIVGGYLDDAGSGAAWVYTRSGDVWTQQGSKLVGTGAVGSSYQGQSVSLSDDGNTAIVGGYNDNAGVGAAWVYTRSGGVWTQQGSKLVGTGAVGSSYQGYSVSLSADGNTAIVGGYLDNNQIGAAWVYTRSAEVWTQQGNKLVGTGAVGQSTQGTSVSISADGNTAIVGGYYDNSGAGAAWVYTRSGGIWTQQGSKLVGTGRVGQSYQGQSVSLSDDGNTAIVGGYNDNAGVGATWVYTRSGGVWTQQGSKLIGTGAVGQSNQGYSVSISADGNTVIVGGFFDNSAIGAAWVFTQIGGVWTQQGGKLVGTGAVGSASQGYSVSVSADGNTAIVGGFFDNNNFGAAWVYTRSGGVWIQQGGKLVGTGAIGQSYQGQSVSISADGNTAIVGGYYDNSGIGAAWVYTRSGGVWTQQGSKLVGTGFAIQSFQGSSVSLSSDGNTAIVGGKQDQFGVGAAWVFIRSGGVWTQQGGKLVGTGADGSAEQGYSVSISADGNTAIVGGFSDNSGVGAAWVYTHNGGVWTQQGNKLFGTDAIGSSRQGQSVSLNADGNTAIVGGYSDNSGTGAAWVYTRSGGVWTQQGSKLIGTGSIPQSSQGSSVSLSADGNTAIVGGFIDNGGIGAAWVYTRGGGVWTQQGSKLVGTGSVGQSRQGWSVSLSADGNTAIVGGYQDNGLGAVWMYTVSPTPPTIASITPATGPVGTLVTITGTNLSNPTSFTIGGTPAIVISNTGTTLVAMVMPGAVTGNVSVTTVNGTATSGGSFTVTPTLYPNTQQNEKLVGTGAVGNALQGTSVAVSADGNTAIVGGSSDNSFIGAAWVYTRNGNNWIQQGSKLVGTDATAFARHGYSVSISADGNTAIVGGYGDNSQVGAAWIFIRSGGIWTQQGNKLVGTGSASFTQQGISVSISADGNTAIVGAANDNNGIGAAWVYIRSGGVWTQQGSKLVGTGAIGNARQSNSVSISADGNTAIAGGYGDNGSIGAAWVFTRNNGVWTQQGSKLVGSGAVGQSVQGFVSVSADGNTAIVGGGGDNGNIGAAWIYTRNGGVWTQQGNKLVGTGAVGGSYQGNSVSLTADGNTAIVGGSSDNNGIGAAWVYTRNNGTWTQQSSKLVGTGAIGNAYQGYPVSLSADGSTAIIGGSGDNNNVGAAWVFQYADLPTIQATSINFTDVQTTQMTLNWTNGDGSARAVFVRQGSSGTISPINSTTYTANTAFGSGTEIDASGWYCVYNGSGSAVTVTGLSANTEYVAQVFEYNGSAGSELYNTGTSTNNPNSQTTLSIAPTITSITPETGAVGTLVTVTGKDLSNPTAFTIGGTPAIVISNDGTTLVGMVMPGAVTGNVSVTTANGTASSGGSFTVTPTLYPNAQQGGKLVGTGGVGQSRQGLSVAVSADGNTAIIGGYGDNGGVGAAWVYTRNAGVWTQQGDKLLGTGSVGQSQQGKSVSLSADGNTAIVGGHFDNSGVGATWVYTRSNGVWTQQGSKLIGTGSSGSAQQGNSVSLSADGNTAIVGGLNDNNAVGAAWVYTRTNGVWTQHGIKLVGTGFIGESNQGYSVSISADGNTAIVGGKFDNNLIGAVWVYHREGSVWTQQGGKLVGTGSIGGSQQGFSVSLSADGNIAIVGGFADNGNIGASWIFTREESVWTQQGNKLGGIDAIGGSLQGNSVSLSADGNTAIVGGYNDNSNTGATWVFTCTEGVWSQQGSKLVGLGASGQSFQGASVSISADGNIAIVGGHNDNNSIGAAWVFTNSPCANPTIGGIIGNAQSSCGEFTPSSITSTELPSGHTGTLEYKWQISSLGSGSGFSDIPNSNTETYTPGVVSQTSWYNRLAKVTCMNDWTGAVESNVIEMTVYPVPLTPEASVTEQPSCSLGSGTITVSSPLPSEGIFYSIDGLDYTNTTGVFTGVVPGDYEVTVKDGNECISEATNVTVDPQPSAPTITIGSLTHSETCGGMGSIVLNFTNVPDGTYSISYTTGSFTNVTVAGNTTTISAVAGTYNNLQITVSGCTSATGVNVTLSDPGVSYGTLASGDQSFCGSGNPDLISFSTMPAGSATFDYQWYYRNGLNSSPTGTSTAGWTIISGATSSSYDPPAGLTQSRTFAVIVSSDCGNSVATWGNGSRQITVESAPSITIGVSSPSDFNSDFTLTANPSPVGDYTYLWSPGGEITPGITLNSTNTDGLYSVVVSTINGCSASAVSYDYRKQNLVNSYTILGLSQVDLSPNNYVQTGSVGNTAKNGKVTIGPNSSVNGPGAFVKAKSITVAPSSLVPVRILQPVTAALPAIRTNTSNTKGLANLNVANNQTNTYLGNYKDVTIGTNCNVTFSGTVFGKINIGQSSQVTFTATTINVESISSANGTAAIPGRLLFGSDASVLVNGGVTIGNYSQVNTVGNYSVVFYMNGFDFHIMPGGNVTVNASVYSPKGSITVEGHTTNTTNLYGTFIANTVTSKNNNIYWNSEAAVPLVVPAMAVVKSAKIEPDVMEPQVKVYPNPFTDKLNIEFSNETDAHARLEIYSITGAKLETLFDGNILGGDMQIIEYLPKLVSSQMVFYHLVIDDKRYIGKVLYNERK